MAISYGSTPGTKVILEAGSIQGIEVGEEEKLVFFGKGDPTNGSASTNSPTKVASATEAENAFGEDTELTRTIKDALNNGVNADYLWGVMPATQSVTGEDISGGGDAADSSTGTVIGNTPLIEDTAEITVEDDAANVIDVEFRYNSPPATPQTADTAFIRPQSGEVETDAAADFEVDYKYLDWQAALDSADTIVDQGESGVFITISEAEDVASKLAGKCEALRDPEYRMVKGWQIAEPNASTSENSPGPMYETTSYSDSIDSLPTWLAAPGRQNDSIDTILGAIGGVLAGNDLRNPILTDSLNDVDLETGVNDEGKLDHSQRADLRGANVVPIKQEGSITIDGTESTDESTNWEATFQTVRVIDRAILLIHAVGEAVRGELDTDGRDDIAAQESQDQLEDLAADGLLEANDGDETNLFVRPVEGTDQGTIKLEVGLTPVQAVDTFETIITIA